MAYYRLCSDSSHYDRGKVPKGWEMKTKYGKMKHRPFKGICEHCRKEITMEQAYQYVDQANHIITMNAPHLCRECHNKQYWNDQK